MPPCPFCGIPTAYITALAGIGAFWGSFFGKMLAGINTPFSISSAQIAAFFALISAFSLPWFFPHTVSVSRWLCAGDMLGAVCLCVPLFPQGFQFLRREVYFPEVERCVPSDKIEVNPNLLCGFNAAFPVTLMDKNFLRKFIQHSGGKIVIIPVFINKGDKFLR